MNKLSQAVIIVFYLLVILLTSPSSAHASTEIIDNVDVDTTWTTAGSPYIISLPISVLPSATLSIEPGVVVKFDADNSIYVEGVLEALGTTSDPIIFTSYLDDAVSGDTNGDGSATLPEASDWRGIAFVNPSLQSKIANAEIHYVDFGISNSDSSISISDVIFKNINSGIVAYGGNSTLKNISFDNAFRFAVSLFNDSVVTADTLSITGLDAYNEVIDIYDDATLTLRNSSFAGSGAYRSYGLLVFSTGSATVDGSIFSNFDAGIIDFGDGGASVKVTNSQIKNNNDGIVFYADDSSISVSGNTIHNNSRSGAQLYGGYTVNLKNNFWGDETGPYHIDTNPTGTGNAVKYFSGYNNILYRPWLTTWPSEPVPCCSSVIFVPGFQGSRLYEEKGNGDLTQRWEAGIASINDVKSLFMDENGNSVKSNIVTKDVIERTNYTPDIGNKSIYKAISDWLRSSTISETISDFFAFPYDWRLDVSDIAQNGTETDTQVLNLKDKIISLAQNSKTEKVTLIGHSNGGLLVKKTIELLKSSGQANLVDKIIFVASPQLGTPHALGSLLHGDDTEFLNGIILNSITARTWGQSMPGVYGLIPSEKLYHKLGSFIKFDSPLSTNWRDLYGEELDYSEQANFLAGGDGRRQPRDSDLQRPTILKQMMLDKATALHDSIDNLEYPANIEVYEIAGIGGYTRQSITYKSTLFGLGSLDHESTSDISCNGDKTVVIESAIDKNQNPYYLDLYDYNKLDLGKFGHANIMENPEVVNLISNIITGGTESTPHITSTKPSMDKCRFKRFGMHSPADIDVYDSEGRHLGINKDQSTDTFKVFDTEIPGSDFYMIGDQKFAIVPDEGEYTLNIDGTGNGLYTIYITTHENDQVMDQISFSDLPVTPKLKGSMIVDTQSQDELVLSIDSNGDGVVDQEIVPNNGASPLSYLEVLHATILELELSDKVEKSLLHQIDRVVKLIEKNKIEKAGDKLQKFIKKLDTDKRVLKEMAPEEKEDLVDKINSFLSSL